MLTELRDAGILMTLVFGLLMGIQIGMLVTYVVMSTINLLFRGKRATNDKERTNE